MSSLECRHISFDELSKVHQILTSYGDMRGLELHPFNIGWYNEKVGPRFVLPYHDKSVAFIVCSQPSMFEKAFIPYIKNIWDESLRETECDILCDKIQEDRELMSVDCHSKENNSSENITPTDNRTMNAMLQKLRCDPLDQCMKHDLENMVKGISNYQVDILHDFDMTPSRKPKVLVQTAGYVAGAVNMYRRDDLSSYKSKYYKNNRTETENIYNLCKENGSSEINYNRQTSNSTGPDLSSNISNELHIIGVKNTELGYSVPQSTINNDNLSSPVDSITPIKGNTTTISQLSHEGIDPWKSNQKIFPVCLHPKFGGWFALRGILVLKDVICTELVQKSPICILDNREDVIDLLQRYNFNWDDYSFRDAIPVKERYSPLQIKYFSTAPKHRTSLLKEIVDLKE